MFLDNYCLAKLALPFTENPVLKFSFHRNSISSVEDNIRWVDDRLAKHLLTLQQNIIDFKKAKFAQTIVILTEKKYHCHHQTVDHEGVSFQLSVERYKAKNLEGILELTNKVTSPQLYLFNI